VQRVAAALARTGVVPGAAQARRGDLVEAVDALGVVGAQVVDELGAAA
jgi:hypothetical protein